MGRTRWCVCTGVFWWNDGYIFPTGIRRLSNPTLCRSIPTQHIHLKIFGRSTKIVVSRKSIISTQVPIVVRLSRYILSTTTGVYIMCTGTSRRMDICSWNFSQKRIRVCRVSLSVGVQGLKFDWSTNSTISLRSREGLSSPPKPVIRKRSTSEFKKSKIYTSPPKCSKNDAEYNEYQEGEKYVFQYRLN